MGCARPATRSLPTAITTLTVSDPECRFSRLSGSVLLAGIPPVQALEILMSGRSRAYEPDEAIFVQGEPANALFLIECGSVKFTQVSPDGNEVILWVNGIRDAFGLQGQEPSNCAARVVERCKALFWDQSRFSVLLSRYPQLQRNLNQILVHRVHELEERFREVATERVAYRLATTLLRLQKRIGRPSEGGIRIPLSREELAQMTGTTLFTVSRLLSKWGDEGIVIPRREAVIILHPRSLEVGGSTA